jgi:ribosomal protein L21E
MNRAWENIKENIKTSGKQSLCLKELKDHKPWSDEECLGFLDQRKQAKRHWVQDPSQSSVDNLHNVRCEASRHFRNKKKVYLKAKIEEFETGRKIKNITDLCSSIRDFKKDHQPRTNIVKDEKNDLVCGLPQYIG